MLAYFRQLDGVLRGDSELTERLDRGHLDVSVRGLFLAILMLAIAYGACVGAYTPIRTGGTQWMQLLSSAIKIPLLFGLTLLITLPSLYVFSTLMGSKLNFVSVVRLLVMMVGVMVAVLASLGPIIVFFSISTDSYPFMQLLNVIVGSIGGFLGVSFLMRTLSRLIAAEYLRLDREAAAKQTADPFIEDEPHESESVVAALIEGDDSERAANRPRSFHLEHRASAPRRLLQPVDRVRRVFTTWMILFAVVGAQMSWVLRPFLGHPNSEFVWFRERSGNFFLAVLYALGKLLGIEGGDDFFGPSR